MSGIAGIVHWHGRPASRADLRRMLRPIERRGPDGLELEVAGEVGFGHAHLALGAGRRHPQPVWLPDRSCGLVADARLYNRAELRAALGRVDWPRGPASDAALILAGYERWGERVVERLDGDFAFVIWNRRERRILAARDPFGGKPLFYAAGARSFYCGSEPKQLLALPALPVEPDPRSVAEFLLDRMGAGRRSYFRGIERLRPGHYLSVREGRSAQRRYWDPRPAPPSGLPPADYPARLRDLLLAAVERRLAVAPPVVFELSGGLDSSSLALLAGSLQGLGGTLPRLATLSAVFPGREFDESRFVDAVARRLPFPGHKISPFTGGAAVDLAEQAWIGDSPDADPGAAWKREAGEILAELGARVLVCGLGGDELLADPDELSKRGAGRRWRPALRRLLGRILPAERSSSAVPSAWIRPDVRPEVPDAPDGEPARRRCRPARRAILDWLGDPRFHYVLEQNEVRWSRQGVEPRHPFLDRKLIDFVLATPLEVRAGSDLGAKSYLRSALASELPPELLARPGKAAYDAYYGALARDCLARLRERLPADDEWLSARYLRRRALRSLRARMAEAAGPWGAVRPLWAVGCLELWLRRLPRYEMIRREQPRDASKEVRSA